MINDDMCTRTTITAEAIKAAADAVDKASSDVPFIFQHDELLIVQLPAPVRDCSTCRWGDKSPLDDKHLCWGLESVDAEICRKNGFSSWEAKREGLSHGDNQ